ncbi:DNA cytosine-5--methyltransferase [Heterostelium album PN500]|uniref:DNA cytosine-5--methyltransferase n=1 Tax=Heterostelium pallidum (strain ATCC 26659 / Pp 5 / PN500) TaxID=670386 RepID=D3AWH9_HETP5|nr:DNA cytosine-5--methyltransferase [Heterostelium album PN500]EFA86652.1 DNA cytosine-5--methyltransferase [Heterostelium album PN500]|eukprot:XP_020438757.1 DNA cytosine-5--methyltransferase [Heterostelium album PN500]
MLFVSATSTTTTSNGVEQQSNNNNNNSSSNNETIDKLRILEFFSGIGGMYYSTLISGIPFEVLQSFDINTNANDVYNYNISSKYPNPKKHKVNSKSIDALTTKELESFRANTWLMSPPCQPFTRVGLQKDLQDNRTNSFVHLLEQLAALAEPPTYILIENVYGFEKSNARDLLLETFNQLQYQFQEFHLTPTQFGLPNQRLRYFCIAKKVLLNNDSNNNSNSNIDIKTKIVTKDNAIILKTIPSYQHTENNETNTIEQYLDESYNTDEHYYKYKIPEKLLLSKGMLFDIKTINDKTTNCFTKAYSKFVEGTGSVLQLDTNYKADINVPNSLIPMKLRYFSPKEITRFHFFPEQFQFPPSVTVAQGYRLIGNSLNCKIVSELLKYLFYKFNDDNNNNNNNSNDNDNNASCSSGNSNNNNNE